MEKTLRITYRPYESILESWKKQNHLTTCERVFGKHEYAYIGNNIWLFKNGRAVLLNNNHQSYIYGTWDSSDGSITFDNDYSQNFLDEYDFYNILETARFSTHQKIAHIPV